MDYPKFIVSNQKEESISIQSSGGSRISGKGVHMYKGVGVRSADFIYFLLNIP